MRFSSNFAATFRHDCELLHYLLTFSVYAESRQNALRHIRRKCPRVGYYLEVVFVDHVVGSQPRKQNRKPCLPGKNVPIHSGSTFHSRSTPQSSDSYRTRQEKLEIYEYIINTTSFNLIKLLDIQVQKKTEQINHSLLSFMAQWQLRAAGSTKFASSSTVIFHGI